VEVGAIFLEFLSAYWGSRGRSNQLVVIVEMIFKVFLSKKVFLADFTCPNCSENIKNVFYVEN